MCSTIPKWGIGHFLFFRSSISAKKSEVRNFHFALSSIFGNWPCIFIYFEYQDLPYFLGKIRTFHNWFSKIRTYQFSGLDKHSEEIYLTFMVKNIMVGLKAPLKIHWFDQDTIHEKWKNSFESIDTRKKRSFSNIILISCGNNDAGY